MTQKQEVSQHGRFIPGCFCVLLAVRWRGPRPEQMLPSTGILGHPAWSGSPGAALVRGSVSLRHENTDYMMTDPKQMWPSPHRDLYNSRHVEEPKPKESGLKSSDPQQCSSPTVMATYSILYGFRPQACTLVQSNMTSDIYWSVFRAPSLSSTDVFTSDLRTSAPSFNLYVLVQEPRHRLRSSGAGTSHAGTWMIQLSL